MLTLLFEMLNMHGGFVIVECCKLKTIRASGEMMGNQGTKIILRITPLYSLKNFS